MQIDTWIILHTSSIATKHTFAWSITWPHMMGLIARRIYLLHAIQLRFTTLRFYVSRLGSQWDHYAPLWIIFKIIHRSTYMKWLINNIVLNKHDKDCRIVLNLFWYSRMIRTLTNDLYIVQVKELTRFIAINYPSRSCWENG